MIMIMMMMMLLYLFLFLLSTTTIVVFGGVADTVVLTANITTTSDRTQYYVGDTIRFTQIGDAIPISSNDYIIPESMLSEFFVAPIYPPWSFVCRTENKTETTRSIVCTFHWQEIFQLNAFFTNKEDPMHSDTSLLVNTNLTIIPSENLQMNFFYVNVDMNKNAYSISNPFTFQLNDINVTLDKTSYVQGEKMKLKFQQSNGTELIPSYKDFMYIKVYEVPFSYKYDLLQFNNATQVKYESSETNPSLPPIDEQHISWQKSGKFQMVLFQRYYQIVLAVSDVFTVQVQQNLTKFNVSMNNRTYHPHQYIAFDVSVPATENMKSNKSLVGRQVSFTFVTANTTQRDLGNVTKVLDTLTQTWTSNTFSEQFLIMNTMVKRGFYKVFVSISAVSSGSTNFAIHTTKAFRVVSPLITTTTNPSRRRFLQGEAVNFTFYNPYFDFKLYRSDYYAHTSFIVDAKFPNHNDTNPSFPPPVFLWLPISNEGTDYGRNVRIYLPPGRYKVIIVRQMRTYGLNTFVASVPNTFFTVVSNNFTFTTDKDYYTTGDSISVQFSTERKIPLTSGPPIYWYIRNTGNQSASNYISYAWLFDQSSSSGTVLSSTISMTGTWYVLTPGEYYIGVEKMVKKKIVIQ